LKENLERQELRVQASWGEAGLWINLTPVETEKIEKKKTHNWRKISLCSSDWPWTNDPSASASWVMGFWVWTTIPGSKSDSW
jgi:hypothetical protein